MPEEVNRVLTDAISDLLFTTEENAIENLKREGIDPAKVSFVGNVMIDSLFAAVERAVPARATLEAAGASAAFRNAAAKGFGLVTLHRPSNVDDPKRLGEGLETLAKIAGRLPLVFPLHPRTRAAVERAELMPILDGAPIFAGEPLGYLAIVGLMREAKVVITDSGGVQEETTALGVPCLTVRPNTERPITIEEGTNTLVGADSAALLKAVDEVLAGGGRQGRVPRFWDGHAAERIADRVAEFLRSHRRNA
jgi:UDP-N-acetylglucosamine 2-epimerase (non-hydrolysing)